MKRINQPGFLLLLPQHDHQHTSLWQTSNDMDIPWKLQKLPFRGYYIIKKLKTSLGRIEESTIIQPKSIPFRKLGGTVWALPPPISSRTQSPLRAPSGRALSDAWESSKPPGRNGRLLILPLTKSLAGPGIRNKPPESWAPSISSAISIWGYEKTIRDLTQEALLNMQHLFIWKCRNTHHTFVCTWICNFALDYSY